MWILMCLGVYDWTVISFSYVRREVVYNVVSGSGVGCDL